MIPAYPLQWPAGWPRTNESDRSYGRFGRRTSRPNSNWKPLEDIGIAQAVERLRSELVKMGIVPDELVISTNLQLRLDGLPRSDQREPGDSGAAVYWRDKGATRCMAIDQYTKVAQNLAALAATIEAMRAIERHGGAQILDRAFTGFTALPAPGQTSRGWRDVLDVGPDETDLDIVKAAYRRKASDAHPDRPGGSHDAMGAVNQAWEQAQASLSKENT